MARSINSPGIQIIETDLSLNQQFGGATSVFIPGFAPQGPTDEVLLVSTISEFETIYGTPDTAAERYFYQSCKEVLNSPATLLTTRLPYGSGSGVGFATQYSALFYPLLSTATNTNTGEIYYPNDFVNPLSGTVLGLSGEGIFGSDASGFVIGEPVHISLDATQYEALLQNNFVWDSVYGNTVYNPISSDNNDLLSTSLYNNETVTVVAVSADPNFLYPTTSLSATYNEQLSSTGSLKAFNTGIIVLNSAQTTTNELFEGYYVSFADNTDFGPETNFDKIHDIKGLNGQDSFYSVPTTRLNFALSGAAGAQGTGSISETIESIPTYNFGDPYYKDSLVLNVFRVRNSIYEPQSLVYSLVETHIGSLDSSKKTVANVGGNQKSMYLEEITNNSSSNIKVLVNPAISQKINWASTENANPSKYVNVGNSAQALFAGGVYVPTYTYTDSKSVGSVVQKIERALTHIESAENVNIDVVCDAGLSTIFANSENDHFDDGTYIDTANLTNPEDTTVQKWKTVFNSFNNFVQNVRKDCVFIADPLRQIFVNGDNVKTLSVRTNNFTTNIFSPLKNLFAGINTNYSTSYVNWLKTYDVYADRFVWVPSSGYVAAIYARTDANSQPWIAPAGLTRGVINNIVDLAFNPNQKQRDYLYTISLNPIVSFPGDGYVVFGQKTLQAKPSAFDRVNVRRLFLTLERAVQRTVKYFVFEPNSEFTRTRVKNTITPIFELAKNTEGLYDYLIVCDERNNTPDLIDRNEMAVDIYIKPVRAAEFILVNFIATRTGQNFQELI